jgi:peptidoglycan hydrolase FlgJ
MEVTGDLYMNADISSAGVYTDIQGLERLRNTAKDESPDTLRAVAKQFEALFMQMMLKNMRDASLGDGIFDNDQTKFYQEMFDKQISISMSERQGLGIADMIVRQLSRKVGDATTDNIKTGTRDGILKNVTNVKSPRDFVNTLRPIAEKVSTDIGIPPEVMLAQAALETGWGRNVIQHQDGRSSHNLFGIKADAHWPGDRVTSSTIEFEDGVAVRRDEKFRAYESYEDSFRDYINFVKTSKRYDHAVSLVDNPAGFVSALQDAGYSTDPDYAQKISEILKQPVFTADDNAVKDT